MQAKTTVSVEFPSDFVFRVSFVPKKHTTGRERSLRSSQEGGDEDEEDEEEEDEDEEDDKGNKNRKNRKGGSKGDNDEIGEDDEGGDDDEDDDDSGGEGGRKVSLAKSISSTATNRNLSSNFTIILIIIFSLSYSRTIATK